MSQGGISILCGTALAILSGLLIYDATNIPSAGLAVTMGLMSIMSFITAKLK